MRFDAGGPFGEALKAAGVRTVFGVAGMQNVEMFEGLRRSDIRLVTASSELAASFMANGHARITRRAAVLATIPGPGFTFALPGVAEARLDHVPLVWICVAPEPNPDGRRALQELPQTETAAPLVKAVVQLREGDDVSERFAEAVSVAERGEPGPVLLHVAPSVVRAPWPNGGAPGRSVLSGAPPLRSDPPVSGGMEEAIQAIVDARSPVLFLGAGALDAVGRLREVVERLGCPVVTTTSARGVVPEDHPLCMVADRPGRPPDDLNALVERADRVLVLGCAFTHNGTHGFGLRIPLEKLVWVNSRPGGPPPPYEAVVALEADARPFLDGLAVALRAEDHARPTWSEEELEAWRDRFTAGENAWDDPPVQGMENRPVAELLLALRAALPPEAILVTDSGRHQMLVRRHFQVLSPNGLLIPSDLQSMGFGIPVAIGAKIAAPARPVVALVGDGGFQVTGSDLLSAMREGVGITTVVFHDEELALIAEAQRRRFGHTTGIRVQSPDYPLLAAAYGMRYLAVDGDPERAFRWAIRGDGPALVEVRLGRSRASRFAAARSVARNAADRTLGVENVRRLFGKG